MFEVALLIIAIAFAVLVGVFIPLGVKLYKTVDVVNETIDETKQTIKVLTVMLTSLFIRPMKSWLKLMF